MPRLKKGSIEAKNYMAKIRAKKTATIKKPVMPKITGISDYKKAPADVKKLVDSLEFMYNANDIKKVVTALSKKGYYIDMSMDGSIETFKKLPSKTKLISGVKLTPDEQQFIREEAEEAGQGYTYRAKVLFGNDILLKEKNNRPVQKWYFDFEVAKKIADRLNKINERLALKKSNKVGYKSDRLNIVRTASTRMKDYLNKGYSRRDALINANKDAANIYGTKKPTSIHKDTKSHNVNIRVVSGINMNNDVLKRMQDTSLEIAAKQEYIEGLKKQLPSMEREDKIKYRRVISFYDTWVKELKAHLRELKKLVK
jgi:hypothetical protein